MDNLKKKAVADLLKKISIVNSETMDYETDLFSTGHLDSFTIINLIQLLEERFEITFDYNDVQEKNFRTLNSLFHLLESKYKL